MNGNAKRNCLVLLTLVGCLALLPGCRSNQASDSLTVYSGRGEELVGPLIEQFRTKTGIDVKVRYGGTAELAATLAEEGKNSPADVFLAQDAGAVGAIASQLTVLPSPLLEQVEPRFRGKDKKWIGISGRARVVAYNTKRVKAGELPDSIMGFTDPKWKGRIGWPPTNGSFQAFVTALRLAKGEEAARQWLEGVEANQPKTYRNNMATLQAVASGEVDVGFVNHYYLLQLRKESGADIPVDNYYLKGGDPGALINVSAAGILSTAKNRGNAEKFIDYLLGAEAQQHFAEQTFEYPLAKNVPTSPDLVPLSEIETPHLDLSDLGDLQKTLTLLRETGVTP